MQRETTGITALEHSSIVDARVRGELVDILFRQFWPIFAGNIAVASLGSYLLWNSVHEDKVLLWASAVLVLTFIRFALVSRFKALRPQKHVIAWGWIYTAMSFLSGVVWGSFGVVFFTPNSVEITALICVVLAGMVGGSVASLSAFPPAYYAYAVPAVLPFAIRSYLEDSATFHVVFVLALFLLAVNLAYSRTIYRTIAGSVRLRFQNLELIDQLKREKERAESASRDKSHVLAAASHDLRQPLHALGLLVGTLRHIAVQAGSQVAALPRIAVQMQGSLRMLAELLDALLDISKLEAGVVEASMQKISVQDLFAGLSAEHGPAAAANAVAVRFRPCGMWVLSDPVILRRVLANLVANAVRYSPNRRVLVAGRPRGPEVEIQVWDTGIGIEKDELDKIFKEFYQVRNVARQREKGLGLGLSIVRHSLPLLRASIAVRSTPGRGSVFCVRVPRADPAPAPGEPKDADARYTAREALILVLDDDPQILAAMQPLLAAWGYEAVGARTLEAALDIVGEQSIDLVIADYRLADEMTGARALTALHERVGRSLPAIIVSGDTSPDRIREVAGSGYRQLHKPVDPDALRIAIIGALEDSELKQRQAAGAHPAQSAQDA